ncbi:MAG: lmo0937 family membrane protein [Porphyromonadaceae bacterium]|nr:lmo0937 family membrane protein [uncultured Macellibacteroides sp.]MCE5226019.1 lmo0937 family membrane protein [Porphyromonadaceae bacterium]
MGNILYLVAVVLIIFWLIGFFAYSLGSIIHILLVLAIISILVRIISGNKRV